MNHEIRNVWCMALNYADTAKEVNKAVPSEPTFFLKSGSTITHENQPIILPAFSREVVHELEVALQFNEKLGIGRVGLALDLTALDFLRQLTSRNLPWTLSKSFKSSCPIGSFFPIEKLDEIENLDFELTVNGNLRQKGNTRDMVFSFQEILAYLLDRFPVQSGDLVLTGTPPGIAPINKGDRLVGRIPGRYKAEWMVSPKWHE